MYFSIGDRQRQTNTESYLQFDCITALRLLLCKETRPDTWRHLLLHRNHIEDRWRLQEEAVSREQQVVVGLLLEWAQLKHSGYTAEEVNMVRVVTGAPENCGQGGEHGRQSRRPQVQLHWELSERQVQLQKGVKAMQLPLPQQEELCKCRCVHRLK